MSFPRGNNARCFLRHGAAFIVADLPRRWSSAVVSPPPRRRSSRVEEGWVEFFHRGGDRALFSLFASPGIPAAFLREKERKERKKIERSTRRLFHKCIAAIGDIIREARRKVQSNIFVFRCFPFTFEREPLVETRTRPRFPCSRIRESRWRVGGPPRLSTPYYLQTIRRFGLIFGAKVLASPDPRLD